MMNKTAKKYVDLFRQVKVATAATVDAQGHPQARIINVLNYPISRCVEFCPVDAVNRLHP